MGDFGDRRVGCGSPGLGGGGKGERAAVEDVFASLLGDQGVEGAVGPAFAGEYEDVVRGSFAEPVPGGKTYLLAEVLRCLRVVSGEPVIEQAEGEADAAGDGDYGVSGLADQRSRSK